MRLPLLCAVLLALLAGCAAPPPKPTPLPVPQKPKAPPERQTRILPDPVSSDLGPVLPDQGALARQFVASYRDQTLYDNHTAATLANDYHYVESRWSPNRDRLMMIFADAAGDSGFVAWSLTRDAGATSLRVEDSVIGQHFALILRPARLCFAVDAASAPVWLGGRWQYDPVRPGTFECNGLTNRSAFQPGTRLPGLLGAYFSEGDTVLLFDSRQQRDEIAGVLARLFPHLQFNPRN